MNDSSPSTSPAIPSAQSLLDDIKKFANEDPAKAAATAFGVGLLLNVLPTRALVGTVAAIGVTLLRPTLLTLGVLKGLELCCKNPSTSTNSSES